MKKKQTPIYTLLMAALWCLLSAPALAQPMVERDLGILDPKTLPSSVTLTPFGLRLTTTQSSSLAVGQPRRYGLELYGRPHRRLYLGGGVAHYSLGLRRTLSGTLDLGTTLTPTESFSLSATLHGGVAHHSYSLDEDVITEHPDPDAVLKETSMRYSVGTSMNFLYGEEDGFHVGLALQGHLDVRDRHLLTRTHLYYENGTDNAVRCGVFLTHSYLSFQAAKHLVKGGTRVGVWDNRLGASLAYEASQDVHTVAAAIDIDLYKGLSLAYTFNMPFRMNGLKVARTTHDLTFAYRLPVRKSEGEPRAKRKSEDTGGDE